MGGRVVHVGARRVKRVIDLAIAVPVLLLASPFLAAIAVVIAARLGRPILYRQVRPGLHGRPFALMKFRTMTNDADAQGRPLPDEERLTALGRFLRRTSLDEVPELWNVVRGEMSIVGPRPLLMEYLPLYTDELAHRHDVLPGLTGWAIVNGRRTLSMEERLRLDAWYVEHWSLRLDARIIARTIAFLLSGQGAEPPHHHAPDMGWTREAEAARKAAVEPRVTLEGTSDTEEGWALAGLTPEPGAHHRHDASVTIDGHEREAARA